MFARLAAPDSRCLRLGPVALMVLAVAIAAAPAKPKAKKPKKAPPAEPVVQTESLAQPADSLAGELVRQRPEVDRKVENDLLNSVDLAKDVVYATSDRPVPENQQYQFIDGVLRTPEKEDARLCFPVKVPQFYRLSIDALVRPGTDNPPLGVGGVVEGHQFFGEFRANKLVFGQFLGRKLSNRLIGRFAKPEDPELHDGAEIMAAPWGVMFRRRNGYLQWMAGPTAWSLDEVWRVPANDQLFLVFPEGQYDIRSVTLEPMEEQAWIAAVTKFEPEGIMAWAGAHIDSAKITADTNPFPEDNALRQAIILQARRADFDELERWADRFRKGDIIVDDKYGAEYFYEWLTTAYAPKSSGGGDGAAQGFFQGQLAFVEEWLKQKPDSVAARIVKGRTYDSYAWEARGGEFADKVPDAAWKLFAERLEIAQTTLEEAAEMKPRDVCVYSSLLYLGKTLDWDREKMLKTLEAGLKITKKDASLLDAMLLSLLPRWGGEPGDMGAFALWASEHIKGPDGLEAYGRIARLAQIEEVGLKRSLKGESPEAYCNLTDPAVVLAEFSSTKLKAALPIMRKRHPKSKRVKNYACWISCVLEERGPAKELFADIGDKPDLAIWETKENYDHWRQWSEAGK